jgi:hypothetical protein
MKMYQQLRELRRRTLAILTASTCIVAQLTAQNQTVEDLPPVLLETYEVTAETVDSYKAGSVKVGAFRDVDPVDVPISVNVLTRELLSWRPSSSGTAISAPFSKVSISSGSSSAISRLLRVARLQMNSRGTICEYATAGVPA